MHSTKRVAVTGTRVHHKNTNIFTLFQPSPLSKRPSKGRLNTTAGAAQLPGAHLIIQCTDGEEKCRLTAHRYSMQAKPCGCRERDHQVEAAPLPSHVQSWAAWCRRWSALSCLILVSNQSLKESLKEGGAGRPAIGQAREQGGGVKQRSAKSPLEPLHVRRACCVLVVCAGCGRPHKCAGRRRGAAVGTSQSDCASNRAIQGFFQAVESNC